MACQLFFSIPILLAAAGLHGELYVPAATPLAWASVAYQAVVVSFMSYLTWFWLISRYPAGRLVAFTFLTPLFGVASGHFVLGEPVSWTFGIAVVLVLAGLVLVNRPN